MKDFVNYWNALNYAFIKYGDLKRKSGEIPYIIHPIRISSILRAVGFSEFDDEELMIAALLHDLVEDTDVNIDEVKEKFGDKIALIVNQLTIQDKDLKEEYLENLKHASRESKIIKLADRLDNLLDMPENLWSKKRQKQYATQAKIILKNCGDAHQELASRLKTEIDEILGK
ncbi:MAG: HD domain-containing protein [Promethearchaeota archaeon]|nr:MAG: HD domain-containing protein [Candidatus Lokiarchaeota archaeon]